MSVGERRSDLEIIRDILKLDQGGPTQIRFSATLSYQQIQRYLAFMEQRELIEMERRGTHVVNIKVTARGRHLLELLDGVFATLELTPVAASGGQ